jgi:hypothetical protein
MEDFETIIATEYTDGEVTETVRRVRKEIATELDTVVYGEAYGRGYL